MLEAEDHCSINNKGSSVQDVFTASENNSNGIISYCVGESNGKTLLIFYQANHMDQQDKVIDDVVLDDGPLGSDGRQHATEEELSEYYRCLCHI